MMKEQEIKQRIYDALKAYGYEYAKGRYNSWVSDYSDELNDEESYYFNSVDSNGKPLFEIFLDQLNEETNHEYCSHTIEEYFDIIGGGVTAEEIHCVNNEYLLDYVTNGYLNFLKDHYEEYQDHLESQYKIAIILIDMGRTEEGISMLKQLVEDGYTKAEIKLTDLFQQV